MTQSDIMLSQRGMGATARRDRWWIQPLAIFLGLSAFVVYSTWGALQNDHYFHDGGGAHYLSPFYSPVLFDVPGKESGHAWFGAKPGWWPPWLPLYPAFLILWIPAGFRLTCYYYRGAYYKAFWADPPSCAVGEPRKSYRGEHSFPLVIQNIHRLFLYFAMLLILILAYDAWKAMWFLGDDGQKHLGLGIGTMVLVGNVILLGGYTFGCHCLRHLIGGRLNSLAGRPARRACYNCVSEFNARHMLWAWMSLFWVGFTDVYIRLCSMGIWNDWHWTLN